MDASLMKECDRHDQQTVWKIGITIFIPLLFALCAGAYTVFTLTESKVLAVALAPIWSVIIFMLDFAVLPLLVAKPRLKVSYHGRLSRIRAESNGRAWGVGLTRLAIGLVLGSVISHSLLLGLFHQRIDTEIQTVRSNELRRLQGDWTTQAEILRTAEPARPAREQVAGSALVSSISENVSEADQRVVDAQEKLGKLRDEVRDLERMIAEEILDGRHSGTKGRCGPYCRTLKAQVAELHGRIADQVGHVDSLIGFAAAARRRLENARRDAASDAQIEFTKIVAQYEEAHAAWQQSFRRAEANAQEDIEALRAEPRSDLLFRSEYLAKIAGEEPSLIVVVALIFMAILVLDLAPLLLKLQLNIEDYQEARQARRERNTP